MMPEPPDEPALPGFQPTLASVALDRLTSQWLAHMRCERPDSNASGNLVLACLLLIHEEREALLPRDQRRLERCLAVAQAGPFWHFDVEPWTVMVDYARTGAPKLHAVEGLLGHGASAIRGWFHRVAWLVRADLNVDRVRPILLQNLADKILYLHRSAALLAALHDDIAELDRWADAYQPDDLRFESQYRETLASFREAGWIDSTATSWKDESMCRKDIWEAVRGLEPEGVAY